MPHPHMSTAIIVSTPRQVNLACGRHYPSQVGTVETVLFGVKTPHSRPHTRFESAEGLLVATNYTKSTNGLSPLAESSCGRGIAPYADAVASIRQVTCPTDGGRGSG